MPFVAYNYMYPTYYNTRFTLNTKLECGSTTVIRETLFFKQTQHGTPLEYVTLLMSKKSNILESEFNYQFMLCNILTFMLTGVHSSWTGDSQCGGLPLK